MKTLLFIIVASVSLNAFASHIDLNCVKDSATNEIESVVLEYVKASDEVSRDGAIVEVVLASQDEVKKIKLNIHNRYEYAFDLRVRDLSLQVDKSMSLRLSGNALVLSNGDRFICSP